MYTKDRRPPPHHTVDQRFTCTGMRRLALGWTVITCPTRSPYAFAHASLADSHSDKSQKARDIGSTKRIYCRGYDRVA